MTLFTLVATVALAAAPAPAPTAPSAGSISGSLADWQSPQAAAKQAVAYNDTLAKLQLKFLGAFQRYQATPPTSSQKSLAERMFRNEMNAILSTMQGDTGFRGDTSLRDAMLERFTFYRDDVLPAFVALNARVASGEAFDQAKMQAELGDLLVAEATIDATVIEVQRAFAAKWGFQLA